jgi:hypothetical protein
MYFARPLADLFAATFGVRFLRLVKPSSNREAYLGFDEGWVRHDLTPAQFETSLRTAIATQGKMVDRFYVGYFMQFKRVHRMKNRSDYTPAGWHGEHYRSEIDTSIGQSTSLSQHEVLVRLSRLRGADVSYACGMIFDAHAIYDDPSLDTLRIVPVDAAVAKGSATWKSGERHFIYFPSLDGAPEWCSDPFEGVSWHPREWVDERREVLQPRNAEEFLRWLRDLRTQIGSDVLPFLTIVEFEGDRS